jgi:hypothetical protein
MKNALAAATAFSAVLCGLSSASAGPNSPNINVAPRIAPTSMQRMELSRNLQGRTIDSSKQSALPKKRVALPKQGRKLNKDVAKANQLRDAAQIRDAGNALRIPVTGGFGDDRFGDPLNPAGADASATDAAQTAARIRAMFGLGGSGPDWLGLLNGPLGGHSNQHHRSTFPGLVPDTSHVPGVSAMGDGEKGEGPARDPDGNIRTSTTSTDSAGNTVGVLKVEDAAGNVTVTKSVSQADGGYWSQTARSDGTTYTYIETASGARREIHTYASGAQFVWGTDRNGREHRYHGDIARTVDPDAATGGSYCPPSGWGCSGPINAADIVAGGRRSQPDPEAQPMIAPSLGMDSFSLVVNPNPDVYAGSGSASAPQRPPCQDCDGDGRGER